MSVELLLIPKKMTSLRFSFFNVMGARALLSSLELSSKTQAGCSPPDMIFGLEYQNFDEDDDVVRFFFCSSAAGCVFGFFRAVGRVIIYFVGSTQARTRDTQKCGSVVEFTVY